MSGCSSEYPDLRQCSVYGLGILASKVCVRVCVCIQLRVCACVCACVYMCVQIVSVVYVECVCSVIPNVYHCTGLALLRASKVTRINLYTQHACTPSTVHVTATL
jgi:hypothetical protein